MNEYNLQLIASLKIMWVAIFSYLYGLGGINNKWIRRYVGSAWMMLGIFGFSTWCSTWNVWYLLFFPLCIGGLSNGYGGVDKVIDKIRRRAIYGLFLSCSAIPLVAFSHAYILFAFGCFITVLSSILLGVWNPTRNARNEETLIASLCFIITLFLI